MLASLLKASRLRIFIALTLLPHNAYSQNNQESVGNCSPNIGSINGDVSITIDCGLSSEELQNVSRNSVGEAYKHLRGLVLTQRYYFLPSLESYSRDPTPQKWQAIVDEVREVDRLISETRSAIIAYESTLPPEDLQLFRNIHGLLYRRSEALLFFRGNDGSLMNTPIEQITPHDIGIWMSTYRQLLSELTFELQEVYVAMRETDNIPG